jgi:hypothetical protein
MKVILVFYVETVGEEEMTEKTRMTKLRELSGETKFTEMKKI